MTRFIRDALLLAAAALLVIILALLSAGPSETVKPVEPEAAVTDPRFIAPEPYRAWVMQSAAEFGIPLDIAIRLAYEESRWDETAMNENSNGTYDYNLFQTNSKYFKIKTTRAHIHEAMRHFAWCWKMAGSLRGAVIVWNAGYSRLDNPPSRSMQLADRVVSGQM